MNSRGFIDGSMSIIHRNIVLLSKIADSSIHLIFGIDLKYLLLIDSVYSLIRIPILLNKILEVE